MHGMSVASEIHDLPNLDRSCRWSFGRRSHITESPGREPLIIETLGGKCPNRLDEATVRVEILVQGELPSYRASVG